MPNPDAYVRAIGHKAKRAYAQDYLAYLRCQRGPVARPSDLSMMAADAVRRDLRALTQK